MPANVVNLMSTNRLWLNTQKSTITNRLFIQSYMSGIKRRNKLSIVLFGKACSGAVQSFGISPASPSPISLEKSLPCPRFSRPALDLFETENVADTKAATDTKDFADTNAAYYEYEASTEGEVATYTEAVAETEAATDTRMQMRPRLLLQVPPTRGRLQ